MNELIRMENIAKSYFTGGDELPILKGINLSVREGEFLAVVGASGSGKSTLMNIIGVLDRPTDGAYILSGQDTRAMNRNRLAAVRSRSIGFVFQNFNLIPRMPAAKNVELPMLYGGLPARKRAARAKELLEAMDMGDRLAHLPNELSGGQKQRVAIARAMANNPDIILADEPTGALDSASGQMIMELFHKLHKEQGKTVLLITHNPELAAQTQRIITIRDGRLIKEENPHAS